MFSHLGQNLRRYKRVCRCSAASRSHRTETETVRGTGWLGSETGAETVPFDDQRLKGFTTRILMLREIVWELDSYLHI